MPGKTLFYLVLSGMAGLLSVVWHPEWGVYGYLVTYNINPRIQWWGRFLPEFASRYALFFSLCTAAGLILHWKKVGAKLELLGPEKCFGIYILLLWISVLTAPISRIDDLLVKMTKVAFMLFMASRIIQNKKSFERMILILLGAALYLSFSLHSGEGTFQGGRFDRGFGGSDFAESNFLAAHFAWLLPFAGIVFLEGDWKKKCFSLTAVVFMLNAIVITRSRGAFLALVLGGLWTLISLPRLKSHRKKVALGLILGLLAAITVTDRAFWERMETLRAEDEDRDASAQSRLAAWNVAIQMFQEHPMGVGIGRFFDYAGTYNAALAGRDTHNTYLRCLAETGILGAMGLIMLVVSSFRCIGKLEEEAKSLENTRATFYQLYSFSCRIALIIYLTAAFFISSTYIEEFYWLLLLPAFLRRALQNESHSAV